MKHGIELCKGGLDMKQISVKFVFFTYQKVETKAIIGH